MGKRRRPKGKPDVNGFIRASGFGCPTSPTALVDVRFNDGAVIRNTPASMFCEKRRSNGRSFWHALSAPDDIVAWRPARGE